MKTSFSYSYLLILAFCCISFSSLEAQEKYTLDQCIKLALENSVALKKAGSTVAFATLNEEQAIANRNPNLSGNSGLNFNFGRSIDPTTNSFNNETFISNSYGVSSGMVLYQGGFIKNSIKQAKIDRLAAESNLSQSEADLALQVATIYLNMLFAEENIKNAENLLTQSKDQLVLINKLVSAGARPKNETLDVEAQIASNEQNIIGFENIRQNAGLQLKQLLRINQDSDIEISTPEGITIDTDPDIITMEEAYQSALKTQPSLRAALLNEESAEYGIKIAKSSLMPTLSIGGALQSNYSNRGINIIGIDTVVNNQTVFINGVPADIGLPSANFLTENAGWFDQFNDNISLGLGINLSVPIYNNKRGKIGIERAELNRINARLDSEQIRQNIQLAVSQALNDARSAKRALEAAEKTVEARKATYENAQKRYEAGVLNSFDLTTSQAQFESAAITAIREKYNYLFSVKILEFYLGKPLKF